MRASRVAAESRSTSRGSCIAGSMRAPDSTGRRKSSQCESSTIRGVRGPGRPLGKPRRALPAGDAEQEQVGLAARQPGVEELGAAEMEDALFGHLDLDAEDGAAAVLVRAHRHLIAVGDFTCEGHAAEEEAGVRAGEEAQPEGPHLGLAGLAQLRLWHSLRAAEGVGARRAEDQRSRPPRQRRRVEGVVEVGVPEDDGVGARKLPGEERLVGDERGREAAPEGRAGQVRIDEQGVGAVLENEPGRAQPADAGLACARVEREIAGLQSARRIESLS